MVDRREKLQQLLDGELDPSEIISDPTLASLAERIYGMDIKAILAEKGIEMPSVGSPSPSSTSLIEVIPSSNLPPPAPLGKLPALEQTSAASRNTLFILLGVLALSVALLNLVMGLGELYNPCTTDWCADNSKFIWLAPHQLTQDGGWGSAGTAGIPDYAMIGGGLILTLLGLRKKV
jgi:hypothetical protein